MDFNITEYEKKFAYIVSDSTLQLTFKKRHLLSLGITSEEQPPVTEKAIQILLSFPDMYVVRLGFLHIF